MKMRPPATPLITIDPYFSVWCTADTLAGNDTRHWTGAPNRLVGEALIDGAVYHFMGCGSGMPMQQTAFDMDYFSTYYTYAASGVQLTLRFSSPLLLTDLMLCSRPVSYLTVSAVATDGNAHTVSVRIFADDELCLDKKGEHETVTEIRALDKLCAVRVGSAEQHPLNRSGDNVRIDWGYFWLASDAAGASAACDNGGISITAPVACGAAIQFAFAYDDVHSLEYFGTPVDAYWRTAGETFEEMLTRALAESHAILHRCDAFSHALAERCLTAGGERYLELTMLAYRQAIAAHKLCTDPNGDLLFVSKECFSNGCAATVDVTYPSIPLFLLFQPELVNAMLRPVFRYAASPAWPFDFAPHDAGCYPLLNGQVYSNGTDPKNQMPVEECGNMLICAYAAAYYTGNSAFAMSHLDLLTKWADYLVGIGVNPDNQLCTDDFAGHLAHNCNLSLKAICALACFARLLAMDGRDGSAYEAAACKMAAEWVPMAANGDGSYRLAFDQPGTFSMKYNMIWDKVFDLGLFDDSVRETEVASYLVRQNRYGLPLDNRADYTKSDWLVWIASLSTTKSAFEALTAPLWLAYDETPDRVPMTDWYFTSSAKQRGFQNRTVQGGIFMRLLLPQA